MSLIVDASVVLAVILAEPGGNAVAHSLNGATISVVNASEVYRRLHDGGLEISEAVAAVERLKLVLVAFDETQAIEAARLRPATRKIGASFADRACLALALKTGFPVLTADKLWGLLELPIDIRMIR